MISSDIRSIGYVRSPDAPIPSDSLEIRLETLEKQEERVQEQFEDLQGELEELLVVLTQSGQRSRTLDVVDESLERLLEKYDSELVGEPTDIERSDLRIAFATDPSGYVVELIEDLSED